MHCIFFQINFHSWWWREGGETGGGWEVCAGARSLLTNYHHNQTRTQREWVAPRPPLAVAPLCLFSHEPSSREDRPGSPRRWCSTSDRLPGCSAQPEPGRAAAAAALHGSLPPLLFQKINRQQQTPTLREATDPDRASATAADAARRRRDLPCQICTEEEILISTSRFVFFSFFSAPSNSSLLGVAVAVTLPSYSLSLSPPPDAWLYTNTRAERIRLLSPNAAHQRQ